MGTMAESVQAGSKPPLPHGLSGRIQPFTLDQLVIIAFDARTGAAGRRAEEVRCRRGLTGAAKDFREGNNPGKTPGTEKGFQV